MKLKLTLFLFTLSFICFSQMTITKLNGDPINNGDVLSFSALTEPSCYLGLKVLNTSAVDINVKIKVESITNADGTNLQLCFGDLCYGTIVSGLSYPSNPASVVPANGSNGNFDHFLNTNPGTIAGQNVDYVFKFYQVNDLDVEIGNSVTFTYRYNPNLSISDNNKLASIGIDLKSNIVINDLNFSTSEIVELRLFNLNGKEVLNSKINSLGNQFIDLSTIASSIYIAQFETLSGKKATTRFIKK
jgi:hypothetical protein